MLARYSRKSVFKKRTFNCYKQNIKRLTYGSFSARVCSDSSKYRALKPKAVFIENNYLLFFGNTNDRKAFAREKRCEKCTNGSDSENSYVQVFGHGCSRITSSRTSHPHPGAVGIFISPFTTSGALANKSSRHGTSSTSISIVFRFGTKAAQCALMKLERCP